MDKPEQKTPERPRRRPPWIKVRAPTGEAYHAVKRLMRAKSLHTVCEEARCPNIATAVSATSRPADQVRSTRMSRSGWRRPYRRWG
jgi:lipoate synthase